MDELDRHVLARSLPLAGYWVGRMRPRLLPLSWSDAPENEPPRSEAVEELLKSWYGIRNPRVASEPIDWDDEIPDPSEPDLG